DVVGRLPALQEVERHLRELLRRAPLQEDHVVRRRDREQLAQQRDRLAVHRLVLLAAVRVLHDAHAAPGKVEELALGPLERGEREGRGAGVEVHDAGHARLDSTGATVLKRQPMPSRGLQLFAFFAALVALSACKRKVTPAECTQMLDRYIDMTIAADPQLAALPPAQAEIARDMKRETKKAD